MRSLWLILFSSLLAAAAVDLGFGAAFISDVVAWTTTAYATGLSMLLVERDPHRRHFSDRLWVRVPLAFTVGGLCLAVLRGPLRFAVPWSEFGTTGHSPYVVFPLAAILSLGLLAGLRRIVRPSRDPNATPSGETHPGP